MFPYSDNYKLPSVINAALQAKKDLSDRTGKHLPIDQFFCNPANVDCSEDLAPYKSETGEMFCVNHYGGYEKRPNGETVQAPAKIDGEFTDQERRAYTLALAMFSEHGLIAEQVISGVSGAFETYSSFLSQQCETEEARRQVEAELLTISKVIGSQFNIAANCEKVMAESRIQAVENQRIADRLASLAGTIENEILPDIKDGAEINELQMITVSLNKMIDWRNKM